MEFFEGMDSLLKTFWFAAIPASLFFIIQTIMTFAGGDAFDGVDADFDGDFHGDAPFQLFSLRNLINFLLGFSWTGISFYSTISNKTLLIFVALAVGLLFIYLFFIIIKQVRKLEEDSSFQFSQTLNKTAEVYLAIPEKKQGKGKILISINGSMRELDAMTEGERIPSNAVVKIVKIENGDILIVESI